MVNSVITQCFSFCLETQDDFITRSYSWLLSETICRFSNHHPGELDTAAMSCVSVLLFFQFPSSSPVIQQISWRTRAKHFANHDGLFHFAPNSRPTQCHCLAVYTGQKLICTVIDAVFAVLLLWRGQIALFFLLFVDEQRNFQTAHRKSRHAGGGARDLSP